MSKEVAIPDNIKAMLASSDVAQVDSMESGGGGVPRISLKKSRFTAKVGEEETKLGDTIQVVILDISPRVGFAKTYYKDGYTPGSNDAPDCSSSDGIKPDPFGTPENNVCKTCPQNQWGSAVSMSGGKAKACKDSKRLYIKLAAELDNKDAPIYLLNITVMSLKPFTAYGKGLASSGIPTPSIVITELGFDDEASVPKLTFKNLGLMKEDNVKMALELVKEKSWDQKIVTPNKEELAPPPKEESTPPKETDETTNDDIPFDLW